MKDLLREQKRSSLTSAANQRQPRRSSSNSSRSLSSLRIPVSNARARTRLLNKLGLFQETSPTQTSTREQFLNKTLSPKLLTMSHRRQSSTCSSSSWLSTADSSTASAEERRTMLLDGAKRYECHLRPPVKVYEPPSALSFLPTKFFLFSSSPEPVEEAKRDSDEEENPVCSAFNKVRVNFSETVQVATIPSHVDYSDRMRRLLWSGSDEIHALAEKNITEFAYEDYNWREALEESDFYVDAWNGSLIHPCHVEDEEYESSEDPAKGNATHSLARSSSSHCLFEAKGNTNIETVSTNKDCLLGNGNNEETTNIDASDESFSPLKRQASITISAQ